MLSRRHLIAVAAGLVFGVSASAQEKSIVVASTTSTQDSGLFGHILPLFKAKTGIDVKVVAAWPCLHCAGDRLPNHCELGLAPSGNDCQA